MRADIQSFNTFTEQLLCPSCCIYIQETGGRAWGDISSDSLGVPKGLPKEGAHRPDLGQIDAYITLARKLNR